MDESLQLQDLEAKVDALYARLCLRGNQIEERWIQGEERLNKLEQSVIVISKFFEAPGVFCNLPDAQVGTVTSFPSLCPNLPITRLTKFPTELRKLLKGEEQQELTHFDQLSPVVSARAIESSNGSSVEKYLDIDDLNEVADSVVVSAKVDGWIGQKDAFNWSEFQGDGVALHLFEEVPKRDDQLALTPITYNRPAIAYGDLAKSTIIESFMAATYILPQQVVGAVKLTYTCQDGKKCGLPISSVGAVGAVKLTNTFVVDHCVEGVGLQTGAKKIRIFDPGGKTLDASFSLLLMI